MKYSDLLKKYIKESRLTLDEVSEKIEEEGLTASKQYLSKLQNGKTPPASEKMNKALARITGGDEEKLIFEAYMEKAPDEVKKQYSFLLKGLKQEIEEAPTVREKILSDKDFFSYIKKIVIDGIDDEKMIRRLETLNDQEEFINILENEIKNFDLLEMRFEDYFTSQSIVNEFILEESSSNKKPQKNLTKVETIYKLPILGSIPAGEPIMNFSNIEDYVEYANNTPFNECDLFFLRVKGDSMINSRIQEGDLVLVKTQPEVENGEIAVVNVNGDEATLKKVRKLENGQTLLIPSNEKYEPILIDNENARIIGKVIQVIFEP